MRMKFKIQTNNEYVSAILQGQGQRMGGGKGNIDHYVTPIRSGRIIIEIAGHCEYVEVCLCI